MDDELDGYGEYMMTKNVYFGKVSMDDFIGDIAATVVENVREKEKREREREKTAVKEEKNTTILQRSFSSFSLSSHCGCVEFGAG